VVIFTVRKRFTLWAAIFYPVLLINLLKLVKLFGISTTPAPNDLMAIHDPKVEAFWHII